MIPADQVVVVAGLVQLVVLVILHLQVHLKVIQVVRLVQVTLLTMVAAVAVPVQQEEATRQQAPVLRPGVVQDYRII